MQQNYEFEIAARSDVGLVKGNNEDNLYYAGKSLPKGGLAHYSDNKQATGNELVCAVCDGMGGQQSGEIASYEAVRMLKEVIESGFSNLSLEDRILKINKYVTSANSAIYNLSSRDASGKGMGTTFSCLLLHDGEAVAMHAGDSRVYHYRDGVTKQLTTDHSENERLIRLGVLTVEQARNHKSRFILSRHLGMPPEAGLLEAEISERIFLQPGDIFLLCSDGLTDMVDPDQLQSMMASDKSIEEKADELLGKALSNGGKDNITVIIVGVTEKDYSLVSHFKPLLQKPAVQWTILAIGLTLLGFLGYKIGLRLADFLQ